MVESRLTNGGSGCAAAFAAVMENLVQDYGEPVGRVDLPWPEPKTLKPPVSQQVYRVFFFGMRCEPLAVVAFQRKILAPSDHLARRRAPQLRRSFKLDVLSDYMICADSRLVRPWRKATSSTIYSLCESNGVKAPAPPASWVRTAIRTDFFFVPSFDCYTLSLEPGPRECSPQPDGHQQHRLLTLDTQATGHGWAGSPFRSRSEPRTRADEAHQTEPLPNFRLPQLVGFLIAAKNQVTWPMTLGVLRRDLLGLIDLLVKTPGRWILILGAGRSLGRYVQLLVHEDGSILYEASSNNFLEGPDRLSPEQEQALGAMGWTEPEAENRLNWWSAEATVSPDTRAVGRRILKTLEVVFCLRGSDIVTGRLLRSFLGGPTPASEADAKSSVVLQPREMEGGVVKTETGERVGSRFRFVASHPDTLPVEDEEGPSAINERIPVPPPGAPFWPDINEFAATYNGYSRLGGGLEDFAELANGIRARYECDHMLPEDLDKLRGALFFYQRRYHDAYAPPAGAELAYIEALVDEIRGLGRGSVPGPPDELY